MNIFFNVNKLGLAGLGATLTSLIRNCPNDEKLYLHFLCANLSKNDKFNIWHLLHQENFAGRTRFIDFDAKRHFGHLRSLHGDWTTYGRLLIPDFINSGVVLYLDCDLIIETDVLQFSEVEFDTILSAVKEGTVHWALERPLFVDKLQWHPDTGYFNAGVLLINLTRWHQEGVHHALNKISAVHSNEFLSADQTLLNLLVQGQFHELPRKLNVPWLPHRHRPAYSEVAIIHFLGSPKPWDMFGKQIHSGYTKWRHYTPNDWHKKYSGLSAEKLLRTWNIRKSILNKYKLKKAGLVFLLPVLKSSLQLAFEF